MTTGRAELRPTAPRTDIDAAALEADIQATARTLFALVDRSHPSLLSQARWQDEMMDWAMADERLKVELFRFVDVFPTLGSGAEIARHLQEYFLQPERRAAAGAAPGDRRHRAALARCARPPSASCAPRCCRSRAASSSAATLARPCPASRRCATAAWALRSTCSARRRSALARPPPTSSATSRSSTT